MSQGTVVPSSAVTAARDGDRRAGPMPWLVALYAVAGVIAAVLAAFACLHAVRAIGSPFERDYGEGIVWQQAALIPGPLMYGDIAHPPWIVFNYPPLYHLAVRAVAAATGNWLVAGRLVSSLADLGTAAALAALVLQTRHAPRPARADWAAAVLAALTMLSMPLVVAWMPLMRVDNLAMFLGFAGVALFSLSERRPWLLHAAFLLFVAAIFTKQTQIAAPVSVGLVALLRDRRQAVRAGLLAAAVALLALGLLSWATHGGFLRHIVAYNVNRFSVANGWRLLNSQRAQAGFVLLGGLSLASTWLIQDRVRGLRAWTRRIRGDSGFAMRAVLSIMFLISGATLALAGKSGANFNYFMEFMCVCCVWIGRLAADQLGGKPVFGRFRWHAAVATLVPLLLIVQLKWIAPLLVRDTAPDANDPRLALTALVASMPGPVYSEDMVMLMQAGKSVVAEPAIVTELASTGVWDQTPLVAMIERHGFSAIVVEGNDLRNPTWPRYTNEVADAIERTYRSAERFGDFRVMRPVE